MKWSDEGSLNLGFVVMCVVSVNPTPFVPKGVGFGGGVERSPSYTLCVRGRLKPEN